MCEILTTTVSIRKKVLLGSQGLRTLVDKEIPQFYKRRSDSNFNGFKFSNLIQASFHISRGNYREHHDCLKQLLLL